MGEFGVEVRGGYWLKFIRYLSQRDVDFAYWALNGKKWKEGDIDKKTGLFVNYPNPTWVSETFGILSDTYDSVRYPWLQVDLNALQESPAKPIPEPIPCRYEYHTDCGG